MRNLIVKYVLLIFTLTLFNSAANAATNIPLSANILQNKSLNFESHRGNNPFATALAMNIQYAPVKNVRELLSQYLNYQLDFFTGWNKNGEAHITVITPPEYTDIISHYLSIDRIEEIALQNDIQSSDLSILGLGRGSALINNKMEETYFIIVHSDNLLKIRERIYQEYLRNGGNEHAWNPAHFYPHITVGYSLRDLHESDGVIKDVDHTLDPRFHLNLTN